MLALVFYLQDGYTALSIAEVTEQAVLIEMLVKVTKYNIKPKLEIDAEDSRQTGVFFHKKKYVWYHAILDQFRASL